MLDLNIVIAGAAGEGVQTIGGLLARVLAAQGYPAFAWQEYESRIRGGYSSYNIRVSEEPRNAPRFEADILLALNEQAREKYRPLLKPDGILLDQKERGARTVALPFTEIASKQLGNKLYANTVAVGALSAALEIELEVPQRLIGKQFAAKCPEVVQANRRAAEIGYRLAQEACAGVCPWRLPKRERSYYLLTGNEAAALGAALAGCRFISAYPMSPATGIITFLAREGERLKIFAEQAEDEIAAINMALGASYAGVRALTATSGGGFSLMVESLSLAGMTETPLVIVLAQRPGPATGLPTRTEQGELLFAINAGHGEFPRLVLAPADPQDVLHKMVRAFDLADKYQIPVIILSDQFLAESSFSFRDMKLDGLTPRSYIADPAKIATYKRYRLTEDGTSPRLYPGQSEHLVEVDSDEHDEEGHITEDLAEVRPAMVRKRLAKLEGLRAEIHPPEEFKVDGARLVLVGWGSSRGAILEAVERLGERGMKIGMIHFTELWPPPDYRFPEGKEYWTVESNATRQLARLLQSEYEIEFEGTISRYDGLPMSSNYIRRWLNDQA